MTAKSEAAQKALEIDKAAALVVDDIFNSLDNDGSKTLDFPVRSFSCMLHLSHKTACSGVCKLGSH